MRDKYATHLRSAVFGILSGFESTLLLTFVFVYLFVIAVTLISRRISQLSNLKSSSVCSPAGRDPRAMDTRGPVAAQRVPMAAGMPGVVPHGMGPNAPPSARPV